jgi:hypothetical protein
MLSALRRMMPGIQHIRTFWRQAGRQVCRAYQQIFSRQVTFRGFCLNEKVRNQLFVSYTATL